MKRVQELTSLKKDISAQAASISNTIGSNTTLLQKLVSDVESYRESAVLASEAGANQKLLLQEAKRKLSPWQHPYFKK